MWRIVRAGYATLGEIYSEWSMVDLLDANIVLTALEIAEAKK